jgi:fibro-slime domain-containing protein
MGPAPNYVAGATMPSIVPPGGMGANMGPLVYKDPGTTVISGKVRCDSLAIRDDHLVQIDGDVGILCEGDFVMRDGGQIELLAGATLEVYVLGDVEIIDSTVNTGFYEPARFALYHLGSGELRIGDGAELWGSVVSPAGTFHLGDNANFYGTVAAADVVVGNLAGLHIDARSAFDQCGRQFADVAGVAGPASTGGITDSGTFGHWFRDVPGVNLSSRHAITLERDVDGMYVYDSNAFYPLDDRLFGNEGDAHNFYFTYTLRASFEYDACADQFLEFEGNDDVWVFVDGKLAMDLGGIAALTEQVIDFDRFGLVDGEMVPVLLLYAHREGTSATFRLRTNVVFETPGPILVSAMFD